MPQVSPRRQSRWSVIRIADSIGDGTGNKNAIGQLTQPFRVTVPAGDNYRVAALHVAIEDNRRFQAEDYGGLGYALTNGISLFTETATGQRLQDITDPDVPIRDNAGWSIYTPIVRKTAERPGHEVMTVDIILISNLEPLTLSSGESFVIGLNDDFTGLVKHHFVLQGTRAP